MQVLDISPKELQKQVHLGYKRNKNFRKSRLMNIRQMVGPYYDKAQGEVGAEPLNLIYTAIRTIVPNLVMNFPKFNVESDFVAHAEYANMLGLALTTDARKKKLTQTYRRLIVDALFTVGTLKTGLTGSDTEFDGADYGTIFTELVDFDDLIIDPTCTDLRQAQFLGDRIRVPRSVLLESGLYDNNLVERLPVVGSEPQSRDRVSSLSQTSIQSDSPYEFLDEVEVAEIWIPSADAVVTVPWGEELSFENYLRQEQYYGPDTGPYSFLQFGIPVPDSPFHAAPASVWHDLHVLTNRIVKKVIDQAERQKTIVGYRRSAADDAQEALDASDGEAVAMDEPEGMREFNFGGQQQSNEAMAGSLHMWFNEMAANPQGMAGVDMNAGSATEAGILQQNANVGLQDMKDMLYQTVAEEAGKRAWFFHTDPLIQLPMTRRVRLAPVFDPTTGMMVAPGELHEEQVILTPEARAGDWLDFTFEVQPESMTRIDSNVRLRQAIDFGVKIMPSVVTTAQQFMLLQIPFSPVQYLIRMAEEVGITWMDEVMFDPDYQMMMMTRMMAGPQPDQSMGQPAGVTGPGGPGAIAQNGQPANIPQTLGAAAQTRQDQQAPAAQHQRDQDVRPSS